MNAFVRRLWRVFLIRGIADLLTLIGEVTAPLLGYPPTVHPDPLGCLAGYHIDPDNQNSCDPNAAYYYPSGQVWNSDTKSLFRNYAQAAPIQGTFKVSE